MGTGLLTAPEVAERLKVRTDRVYELAKQGAIAGVVRVGRQVRFEPDALDRWIAAGGQALAGGWRREPEERASA